VRFIEYMPFDGNKWNQRKMVPYAEMLSHICSRYPDLSRLTDSASDTSKVCVLLFLDILDILDYRIIVIFDWKHVRH